MPATQVLDRPHAAQAPAASAASDRVYSLDVFRGLTMIWMFSNGFGLHFFKDHPTLGWLEKQFTHADWQGGYPWDLIQPFFMFIVGVAMPWSFARRDAAGAPWSTQFTHVLKRAALLVLCGTIARSIGAGKPVLDLINVLAQIAFTYTVAFLLLRRSFREQLAASFALLAAHTAFYLFVTMPGVTGPWDKNANIGYLLDTAVLGKNWGGGYATINCVSSATATVWGMMAGWLLRSNRASSEKLRWLLMLGAAGIAAGYALDPLIPNIKKIWTASFALSSAGWTLVVLAAFHWLIDLKGWRRGTAIIAMVGANSIFIYLFHEILYRWMRQTGQVFTGWAIQSWGPAGNMLNEWLVIAFQIYVCWWLYQRRIFFKL